MKQLRRNLWSWFWVLLGVLYFVVPLVTTFDFSLRKLRDQISLEAYVSAFSDPYFLPAFGLSILLAILTIIFGVLLVVPTAYWVHLRVPQVRPIMEFLTLLPFVIPAIVLVFGMIGTYSRPPLLLTTNFVTTVVLIVAGYIVLALPYLYRSVDAGLRSMDVRTLTEAAESLGANWVIILFQIILPNLRTALLSGALLTLATVVGEVTLASFLGLPTFGPYLFLLGQHKAYEPAALSIVSFAMTWAAMGVISILTRGRTDGGAVTAGH